MNIVISALHFAWQDMNDCLATATRGLGLDGVELSWHESFSRIHCTAEDLEWLASIRGKHRSLLSAHIWNNLAESDPAEAGDVLLKWLQVCDRTGTKNLVMHGGSFADRKEGIARTRCVLERVLPEFERKQVVLNLENHYAYDYRNSRELFSEPWEFREVLTLDSPSLKVCFDTGHGNMTGNTADLLDDHSLSLSLSLSLAGTTKASTTIMRRIRRERSHGRMYLRVCATAPSTVCSA